MLTRIDKKISPEVRKSKQSALTTSKPAAATSTHPSKANFAEAMTEVKRQWKATLQKNLPALRTMKAPNE